MAILEIKNLKKSFGKNEVLKYIIFNKLHIGVNMDENKFIKEGEE